MVEYLNSTFGIHLKGAYAPAWSGVSASKAYNPQVNADTEYKMKNGDVITKGQIDMISGAYKLSTLITSNIGYTK